MTKKPETVSWKEWLLPRSVKFVYICEAVDLHRVTLWVWAGFELRRKDENIVHLPPVVGMLYGFSDALVDGLSDTPMIH